MSNILQEEGVSNDPEHRKIANKADEAWFENHKRQRAAVHGVYHSAIGVGKFAVGNFKGAQSEFQRTGAQIKRFIVPDFRRNKTPSPPRKMKK
ncbi:MAG: hypothetical protein EZS28_042545 [Streblomastix strix]|uniref:Uncharacterized protein n=1 Tax=Streblomastix strix TaxID=222440 RepID=A0A5J4TUU0_9EUKA|nr:MAG: hypothetical protein EZS28_042545 [Streblomastix strix]